RHDGWWVRAGRSSTAVVARDQIGPGSAGEPRRSRQTSSSFDCSHEAAFITFSSTTAGDGENYFREKLSVGNERTWSEEALSYVVRLLYGARPAVFHAQVSRRTGARWQVQLSRTSHRGDGGRLRGRAAFPVSAQICAPLPA